MNFFTLIEYHYQPLRSGKSISLENLEKNCGFKGFLQAVTKK